MTPDHRPGGQGVAGSNPAVPTGSDIFSNALLLHQSQQKSHSFVKWPCSRRAAHVSGRPTRAFAKPAEPGKPPVKESKIAEPPRICTAVPDNCQSASASPAHPATASRTLTGCSGLRAFGAAALCACWLTRNVHPLGVTVGLGRWCDAGGHDRYCPAPGTRCR